MHDHGSWVEGIRKFPTETRDKMMISIYPIRISFDPDIFRETVEKAITSAQAPNRKIREQLTKYGIK